MKKYAFIARIEQDRVTGKFHASFPDFPDCVAEEDDLIGAYFAAWIALERYIYDLEKNKAPIPEVVRLTEPIPQLEIPIEIDMLEIRRKYETGLIDKSLRIPRWLDSLAKENNINFSQTLREALIEKLQITEWDMHKISCGVVTAIHHLYKIKKKSGVASQISSLMFGNWLFGDKGYI